MPKSSVQDHESQAVRMERIFLILFGVLLLVPTTQAQTTATPFHALSRIQERADSLDRPIYVFVEAPWCGICKRMRASVFPDDTVSDALEAGFVATALDLESTHQLTWSGRSTTERELARQWNVRATPTHMFFEADGTLIGAAEGWFDTERLLLLLRYVESGAHKSVTFKEFAKDAKSMP